MGLVSKQFVQLLVVLALILLFSIPNLLQDNNTAAVDQSVEGDAVRSIRCFSQLVGPGFETLHRPAVSSNGLNFSKRNTDPFRFSIVATTPTFPTTTRTVRTTTTAIRNKWTAFQPIFTEPLLNITIAVGRDAVFRCCVHHLGGYRVGWVKADTKAIQAIHDHVITHNPRISVTHTDHTTWNLHLKNIQEEDAGQYMCQINTDPMLSQIGVLSVVVPPDFIPEETSADVTVSEGGLVKLTCKASGTPAAKIKWRKEDNSVITVRDMSGHRIRVTMYEGEILQLPKVSRNEMGAYMCIATNGVPPSISKRIIVNVHFHPVIRVPNQLVGAPLGTDVLLECIIEASPKSINYWMKGTSGMSPTNFLTPHAGISDMVIMSSKYDVRTVKKSPFVSHLLVTVKKIEKSDMGTYRCVAKNSLGEVESSIRLYEIPGPTGLSNTGLSADEDDYDEQFGSAEKEHDEEFSNNVIERGRRPSLQLSIATPKASYGTASQKYKPVHLVSNCSRIGMENILFAIFITMAYILNDI